MERWLKVQLLRVDVGVMPDPAAQPAQPVLVTHNGNRNGHVVNPANGDGNGGAPPRVEAKRRTEDTWLERWMRTTSDLARLQYSHRMVDAVLDEIDGRDIRIGDKWLADYASCNYLGF